MRNIFLFLRRFSTFFTFLFLQIFCLVIIVRFNKHHNAVGITMVNNITGKIHEQRDKIDDFFNAKRYADSVAKRNAELLNAKPANYLIIDTNIKEIADYIPIDTLGNMKKIVRFVYRPTTVVYNTTNDDRQNYMVLARGVAAGVNTDMAVVGAESNAVIGKVVYADAKYSYVMTLLHNQSRVPAKLKNTNDNGTLTWNGSNSRIVTLSRIPKTTEIKKGDSIMTSGSSDIFPEDLFIGTIDSYAEDKTSGNYIIKVKTAANFNHINYVNVIENVQQKEVRNTITEAKKIINKIK